jgi:hypothetical protein
MTAALAPLHSTCDIAIYTATSLLISEIPFGV